jgi:hypothetical protein
VHLAVDGFLGRRARLLDGVGGREVGLIELGKRRAAATLTLDGIRYEVAVDERERRRWHVRPVDGPGDRAGTAGRRAAGTVTIHRPSVWRSDAELTRSDGRVIRAVARGTFRRRFELVDPAAGDAPVARLETGRAVWRTTWDLEVEALSPAEQVACAWLALTTSRSDDAATTAVVAGGAAAAGS